MSANPNSVTNAGEFHDSVPPTSHSTINQPDGGHSKLRTQQSASKQSAPTFHAQVLPPGSGPKDKMHKANPINETPGQSYPNSKKETWTYADDTLNGSTSRDDGRLEREGREIYE